MRGLRRDRLPSPRGHPADLAPHSGPVPRRQLPLSDLLRSVPDRPDVPLPAVRRSSVAMTAPSSAVDARLSPARRVDVRGPRFGAWITTVVLAAALLTG